jgi:hypothetical protein
MSYREPDFAAQVALRVKQYHAYANVTAELTTIATALATDATIHDKTIEVPPAALTIHHENHSPFTNDINVLVNKGKGGNLNPNQMISAIDDAIGLPHKPAVIDVPYAHANATPPVVGTVCSVTNGNWTGSPTAYAYQWKRDGTTNLGATANYTLVAADVPSHRIGCVVSATNAQGTTVAPISNQIQT